jgi:hypothetical protein
MFSVGVVWVVVVGQQVNTTSMVSRVLQLSSIDAADWMAKTSVVGSRKVGNKLDGEYQSSSGTFP